MTANEKRETAYDAFEIIPWGGKEITVTKAAQIYGYYLAEGDVETCRRIQPLIAKAKAEIREHFQE